MKTAMQELYSEIEKFENGFKSVSMPTTDIKRMIGNYYIEKEKEQIIEANRKGHVNGFLEIAENNPEQYYNETFKN